MFTPGSRACAYKTVSGRHEWPNKDPMGERGGANLYGFDENDAVNKADADGCLYYKKPTDEDGGITSCGSYDFDFDLYLSNPTAKQGVVIQYVDVVEDWDYCCLIGRILLRHHHAEYKWWEFMGQVIKGAQANSYISTDGSEFPDEAGTHGTQTVTTTAKFYFFSTTGDAPYRWNQGAPYSNNGTTTQPPYWNKPPDNGEPATGRSVTSSWNCCLGLKSVSSVTTTP
jgi:hypothetical protein